MAAVTHSGFYTEGLRTKWVHDVAYCSKHLQYELEKAVDDVWATLVTGRVFPSPSHHDLSLQTPRPPSYTQPPPSYDDAITDTPPDYSSLPPLAQRKTTTFHAAPPLPVAKSLDQPSSLLKDTTHDVYIDFGAPFGTREHKGGKKKAKKSTPLALGNTGGGGSENGGSDNGDGTGGNDGGGAGDGNGDDGDGGDDWGAWAVSGSKKKSKKKEQEEEEERRAKEEEEKKTSNNLSWADEMEDGNDDSWAGFATVGGKRRRRERYVLSCSRNLGGC